MNQCDPDRTITEHDNGFSMVNTRLFEWGTEPYVLPSQCVQVFYSEVPGKAGWLFVVRHDPRGRLVNYNLEEGNEEGTLEEEDNDSEHDQRELDDHDDPEEDVRELVESGDLEDNAHEDYIDDDMMIVIDLDDDDDMANPYNVEYVSDDTDDDFDDDLDEEDDEVYWSVTI